MAKVFNSYNLKEGMEFSKDFYGKIYKLRVVMVAGKIQYRVGDQMFSSSTAAARHVCGDETRSMSGPLFWGISANKPGT
jgi:hypothetical protein